MQIAELGTCELFVVGTTHIYTNWENSLGCWVDCVNNFH